MFPVRLAVVGSRTFDDEALLERTLDAFIARHGVPAVLVSGGARGADTLAERYAGNHGIPVLILHPDWRKHGRGAGLVRNADVAFWDGSSRGAKSASTFGWSNLQLVCGEANEPTLVIVSHATRAWANKCGHT
jgi:hypothetical protein